MGSYLSINDYFTEQRDDAWESKQMRRKYLVGQDIKLNNFILRKHTTYKPLLFEKVNKKRKKKKKFIL